jgi:ribosomal protein L12E/L44/L45/RPP1/RPP2
MLCSFWEEIMPPVRLNSYDLAEADVTAVLKEAGVEPVAADVKRVVEALKGKNLSNVVAEGLKSLTSLSVGGGSCIY